MFIDSLAFAPALIGLALYGTLVLIATIWFTSRLVAARVTRKTTASRQ